MPATVIHAQMVNGKYCFGIAGPEHHDIRDTLVFSIEGDGVAPRSAPTPATRDEMEDWMARLINAGYKVTQQPVGR